MTAYGRKHGRYLTTELDWAKCGTPSQYRAHYRRGEQPCRACRDAFYADRAHKRARRANPVAPVK